MPKLTAAQLRKKHAATFDKFWAAYPRHTHINEAAKVWGELIEGGAEPAQIAAAARRYAASVAGTDMKFVPGPHRWLAAGQYDDADLFQDERGALQTWLRQQWQTVNVKAIENRFHITMPKVYPPDDVEGAEAIRFWYREQARAWIMDIAKEKIDQWQTASQHSTSEQSKPSSAESSSGQMLLGI